MLRFFTLAFLMYVSLASAQLEELHYLKGKVLSEIDDLTTITVKNSRSETTINPDEKGNFSIFVKINDELIFDGLSVDAKKIVISEQELSKKILAVTLIPKVIELKEVTIREYPEINAVSLGILQKPPKKYTPAERRLEAAGDFKWYYPLLIPLGGMPLDGLINQITGRTNLLKKELEVERRELALKSLDNDFDLSYYENRLQIPSEKVAAFKLYSVENDTLRSLLKNKERVKSEFQLSILASRFLEIQKDEKN